MKKCLILLVALLSLATVCAGGDSGETEVYNYPDEGALKHTINIRILDAQGSSDKKAGNSDSDGAAGAKRSSESGGTLEFRDRAYPVPHNSTSPRMTVKTVYRLTAKNELLASRELRRFLRKYGYKLNWLAKYDCRLKNHLDLTDPDFPKVLADYLRLFSLSAEINPAQKHVVVYATTNASRICLPAANSAVLKGKGVVL